MNIDTGRLLQGWALIIGWLVVLSVMAAVDQWKTARKPAEDDQ